MLYLGVICLCWLTRISRGDPVLPTNSGVVHPSEENNILQETSLLNKDISPEPYDYYNYAQNSQKQMADLDGNLEDNFFRKRFVKRSYFGNSMIKRIHTCAFMRRLGLPIGFCFGGRRQRIQHVTPRPEPAQPKPDAYSYLQNQWPVNSLLGGGVGR